MASCFFTNFVDTIANQFKNLNLAIVGFVGILEKYTTNERHWFTQDPSQAIREWLRNKEEVSYESIHNDEDEMRRYTYGQEQDSTQAIIDAARSNQIDPIVWAVHQTKTGYIVTQFNVRYGTW